MFDCVRSIPFLVIVGCVRSKNSVRPCLYDEVVMHVISEGGVFEFLFRGCTNNCVVLYELRQYRFEFILMYKTQITCVNVIKKV